MKLKRIIAAATAAVMLVSSVFVMDTSSKANALQEAGKSLYESFGGLNGSKLGSSDALSIYDGKNGIVGGSNINRQEGTSTSWGNGIWAPGKAKVEKVENGDRLNIPYNDKLNEKLGLKTEANVEDDELVRIIVTLRGESVIEADAKAELSSRTEAQIASLMRAQERVIGRIEEQVLGGESLAVQYQYTWLLNGIAATVPYGMIDEIKSVAGVADVLLQPVYTVCETKLSDADMQTIYDGVMIGRQPAWETGYTGKGMKIAVIDTGIDEDHQSFGALSSDKLTEDSVTTDDIAAVLSQLNAVTRMPGVTAEKLYLNTKIAFAFNYVDENLHINHAYDSMGDHGTHVAGIAAANKISQSEVVGVAPDAQLMVMKVFGANGGAYAEDIMAALEDALILGADVVNMSLGSTAGFTSSYDEVNEIYGRVSTTDTILAAAAGNDGSFGDDNLWHKNYGYPYTLSTNPDNSVIGSPSTYGSALSVGSVENIVIGGVYYFTLNGAQQILYNEPSNGVNDAAPTLAGAKCSYAMVPNLGKTLEDFVNAGVAGKIAVVSRGETSFGDKAILAEQAGAIGVIVYNNTVGEIYMNVAGSEFKIPCVSVTKNVGELLAQTLEADPSATIEFSATTGSVSTEAGYHISNFSSWGAAPDLTLKPEITAPGGNIYSCYDNGKYGLMSGTSMATPNIAGIAAIVKQYVKSTYTDMSDAEVQAFVNAILMSTAMPSIHNNGLPYSPRVQGSGLANAYNAIMTRAVLVVEGMDRPKVELFDDPEREGVYSFSFSVKNFGEETLFYEVFANAQTESTDGFFMTQTPTELGAEITIIAPSDYAIYDYDENGTAGSEDARLLYFSVQEGSAAAKSDSFRYELTEDESIDEADVQAYLDALVGKNSLDLEETCLAVEAGTSEEISVTVTLTEADKEYMDYFFENGIYVEGFAGVTALNQNGVDLSLPYLAFYGDWTEAPILDSGYYYQAVEGEIEASQYYHVLFTNYGGKASTWNPGLNPFVDEPFQHEYVSVSPNGDGYTDYIDEMYISLLRNCKTLSFTYTNVETGEVYYSEVVDNVSKSYYSAASQMCIPFVYSWLYPSGVQPYQFTDANGNVLPDNTQVKLTIQGELDYGRHAQNNDSDTWEIIFNVDTTEPEVTDAVFVEEDGKHYLDLTFGDNVAVAGVVFADTTGAVLYSMHAVEHEGMGQYQTVRYDVTGYGDRFMVVLDDYALNETAYVLQTSGNAPQIDTDLLYGYRVFDNLIYGDECFAWVSIDPATGTVLQQNSEVMMDYAINAACYVGNYIYAVSAVEDTLYAIVPGLWNERIKIATLGVDIEELAFNPVNHKLYGYNYDDETLIEINILTGEWEEVAYPRTIMAMAFDAEGTLYYIDDFGNLYTMDVATGAQTQVMNLNKTAGVNKPSYTQSMTYSKADDCLYWAAYGMGSESYMGRLIRIDLAGEQVTAEQVAVIGNESEIVGLMMLDDYGFEIPEAEVTGLVMSQKSATIATGNVLSLTVTQTPWNATPGEILWTSSDETVATVMNGNVTGIGAGTAVITATVAGTSLSASCEVKVVNVNTTLNGFIANGKNHIFTWATFNAGDMSTATYSERSEVIFTAADRAADGFIYAFDENAALYKIDEETFESYQLTSSKNGLMAMDMAYDHKSGILYVLMLDTLYGETSLYTVDMLSGALEKQYLVADSTGYPIVAIAPSAEAGVLYMISMNGFLMKTTLSTKAMTETGKLALKPSDNIQSMTYDYANDTLYWSMINSSSQVSIVYVDTNDASCIPLGSLDGGVHMVGLFADQTVEITAKTAITKSAKALKEQHLMMVGGTSAIPAVITPLNAKDRPGTWTVADSSVAVIKDGVIFALKPGTTTVTGTVGRRSVTFTVKVLESAGSLYGGILSDFGSGAGNFLGTFSDADMTKGEMVTDLAPYSIQAGEYFDGKLYAYGVYEGDNNYYHLVFDAENNYELLKATPGKYEDVYDMAFDYSTGVMYALGGVHKISGSPDLYYVDLATGNLYLASRMEQNFVALACSTDGTLYGVTGGGVLCEINPVTGATTELVYSGFGANQYQSMCYDHNTGNLYWAQTIFTGMSLEASLICFDLEAKDCLVLGKIGGYGAEVAGLHTIPATKPEVGSADISGIVMAKVNGLIPEGGTLQLTALATPISVNSTAEVTYTSQDESIATVDANGLVTGISDGSTYITATVGGYSTSVKISVIALDKKLYLSTSNGLQNSPLLVPGEVSEMKPFEQVTTMVASTYHSDGYFYGIDEAGFLWRYTMDLAVMEKVVARSVKDINGLSSDPALTFRDMTSNAFDGKLYLSYYSDTTYEFNIVEVDLTTGAFSNKVFIPEEISIPCEFVFVSANDVIIYDSLMDGVYTFNMVSKRYEQIIFAQDVVVATAAHTGMYYSAEYELIFFATYDDYHNDGMALYIIDYKNKSIEKYADAAYHPNMIDISLIEGAEPVLGAN